MGTEPGTKDKGRKHPMDAPQFEPMSIGQIIDGSFRIYKNNFVRFITIVAIVQVPVSLASITINAVILGMVGSVDISGTHPAFRTTLVVAGVVAALLGFILYLLAYNLSNGALMKSISESYLGKEVTVGEAYRFVIPKLGSIIVAAILVGVCFIVGFILLVVPGVIFSLWFALVTPVIVLENMGSTEAMSRSKALAKGNLSKIFTVSLIIGLITVIVTIIISATGGILSLLAVGGNPIVMKTIQELSNLVARLIIAPVGACAAILLYYDLRIRKEGFDLEMLAQSLGES